MSGYTSGCSEYNVVTYGPDPYAITKDNKIMMVREVPTSTRKDVCKDQEEYFGMDEIKDPFKENCKQVCDKGWSTRYPDKKDRGERCDLECENPNADYRIFK